MIKRFFFAWLNEPTHLGCPDPELHDRNNESRHCDVISTALNADTHNAEICGAHCDSNDWARLTPRPQD